MGRNKTISSEILLGLYNEYVNEYPGLKYKASKFGSFVRKHGYDVPDYTVRRDKALREAVKSREKMDDGELYGELVTYSPLDVEEFIKHNNDHGKLAKAISARDRYYSKIAAMAAKVLDEKNELKSEMAEMEGKIADLKERLAKAESKADKESCRKKDATISKLRNLLKSYVYPDVANAMLQKEGVLKLANGIIPYEDIEERVIQADTDIAEFLEDIGDAKDTVNESGYKTAVNDDHDDGMVGFSESAIKPSKYEAINNLFEGF